MFASRFYFFFDNINISHDINNQNIPINENNPQRSFSAHNFGVPIPFASPIEYQNNFQHFVRTKNDFEKDNDCLHQSLQIQHSNSAVGPQLRKESRI